MGSGKAFRGHQDHPLLERQGPQDHRELMGRGGTRSPPSPCSPLPEVLQEHFPGAHVPPGGHFKRSFPVQSRRPAWAATPGLPASSLGSMGPVGQRGRGLCPDPKTSPRAQEHLDPAGLRRAAGPSSALRGSLSRGSGKCLGPHVQLGHHTARLPTQGGGPHLQLGHHTARLPTQGGIGPGTWVRGELRAPYFPDGPVYQLGKVRLDHSGWECCRG